MSMATPKVQNLTRQLLDLEAAHDKACVADGEVVVRVVEKLRTRLVKLAGVDGFRSLLSRALALATVKFPSLGEVHIGASGTLEGLKCDNQETEEAGIQLVAQLLELLVTFIGEPLTLHLVRDAWPEASMDGNDLRSEDKP